VLENPATFGRTYELGGGERLRFDALLWRLRQAVPGLVLPLPLPMLALRLAKRCAPRAAWTSATLIRLRQSLLADNAPASRDFGYAPTAFRADEVLPDGAAGQV
jgi:hypothetical protein